jgi:hypothetical protein
MANFDTQIRSMIDSFVNNLTQAIRAATVESAVQALQSSGPVIRRGPGRPAGSLNVTRSAPSARMGGKRIRRSADQIESMKSEVLSFVKKNEGARAEEIRKALGLSPVQTGDTLRRLMGEKAIKSKGQKRATTYSA